MKLKKHRTLKTNGEKLYITNENDNVSFLSSFPPKSSGPGGKGFKAVALGLSTGGPHSILQGYEDEKTGDG
ncbi:MAG: hypothetical protein PVH61_16015 [Candidatus Aminicenantes bacterium]|jgi:hypothetical protein